MTKDKFIGIISHWDNYKPLLYESLQNTDGDVLELGMGDGSTAILHEYCKDTNRNLFSYDSDLNWYRKFEKFRSPTHAVEYAEDWDTVSIRHNKSNIGVILVDHAAGERRKYDVALFCNIAKVIVCHDTEIQSDHGYRYSMIWPLFKYVKHYEASGASAAAVSNFIDVTKWTL